MRGAYRLSICRILAVLVLFEFGCVPGWAVAAGPQRTYYLEAGDQNTGWIINGASAASYAQGTNGQYPIAVGTTIRTLGITGSNPTIGEEFTLTGTPTGAAYPYPLAGALFFDGTRDATHNYSVNYSNGNVYQMGLDWSNPLLLFNDGYGTSNSLGITYDGTNNSLWISQFSGSTIADFSLTGTQLSSFNTGKSALTSLALDPADRTLWFGSQNSEGTFYQYSTSGTQLGTQTYSSMTTQNTLGGEFAYVPVPEPTSGIILCVATALTVRRRKQL